MSLKLQMMANEGFEIVIILKNQRTLKCNLNYVHISCVDSSILSFSYFNFTKVLDHNLLS